jgi:hypothetical protein
MALRRPGPNRSREHQVAAEMQASVSGHVQRRPPAFVEADERRGEGHPPARNRNQQPEHPAGSQPAIEPLPPRPRWHPRLHPAWAPNPLRLGGRGRTEVDLTALASCPQRRQRQPSLIAGRPPRADQRGRPRDKPKAMVREDCLPPPQVTSEHAWRRPMVSPITGSSAVDPCGW